MFTFTARPRTLVPSFRPQGERGMSASSWVCLAVIVIIFAACFLLYFGVEQPIRSGQSAQFLGADSGTYYAAARLVSDGAGGKLTFIGFAANLFGPVMMAVVFKQPFLITLVNMAIFLLAVWACGPVVGLSRTKMTLLLLLNATTIVSLVTLNKEIFAIASTLLFCRYVYSERRSPFLLALFLLCGLLARWEQTAITLLFLFFTREHGGFRNHPRAAVLSVIALITVAYPALFYLSPESLTWATGQAQNGGTIVLLNRIQASFGFPLVLPAKALMSLFNHLVTPLYWFGEYWQQDFSDLANQVVVNLQTVATLGIMIVAFAKGRLRLDRPIPLFCALYIVIVSSSPFIQSRYEYPVYVALCFDLARRENGINPLVIRLKQGSLLPALGAPLSIFSSHSDSAMGARRA